MYPNGGGAGARAYPDDLIPRRRPGDSLQRSPYVLVEQATAETLHGEPDWNINMQIVDIANTTPQDCYLFVDALKPKLRSKNHGQGLLAVVLLETLVKNASACHELVATPDVMESHLIKALPRSVRKPHERPSFNSLINEPKDIKSPMALARWDAILRCVAAWAHSFDASRYPIFQECLRMLERRGVNFPVVENGEDAPIFTPKARVSAAAPASSSRASGSAAPAASHSAPSNRAPVVNVDPKLAAEIKAGGEAASVFMSMLSSAEAGYPYTEDELLQQLYATCRSHAGSLSQTLTASANGQLELDEQAMAVIISTHETLVEALQYYQGLVAGTAQPGRQSAAAPAGADDEERKDDGGAASHQSHQPAARSQPQDFDLLQASAPAASPPAPAVAAAAPAHSRRKSDLPPELQGFDMLITPSPPPPAAAASFEPPQPQPVPAPAEDPFSVASFPPASNPVKLHVFPAASPVAAASAAAPGSAAKRGVTSPLIAPPPTSATRHRKDSQAKRGSFADLASGSPVGSLAAASPLRQQQQAGAGGGLLDFDSLLSGSPPQQQHLSTPQRAEGQSAAPGDFFSQSLSQPPQQNLFGDASFVPSQQHTPAQQASPLNVFEALEAMPAHAPAADPFSAAPPAMNPFAAAPPAQDDDPFAALAARSPPKQQNVFDF